MSETNFGFDLKLPKWPQMVVTGEQVTIEQAKEIIFRTDDFLSSSCKYAGGNCTEFNTGYREKAGLGTDDWDLSEYVREKIKYVETQYVSNTWGSSSYVYGPHGWCSPTGVIFFEDNIGKWPTVQEVYDDWVSIATAFPFLNLSVTLISGEHCEDDTHPVVTINVKDGGVQSVAPVSFTLPDRPTRRDLSFIMDSRHEIGLPQNWYDEYAARVKVYADEYHLQNR